MDKRKDVRPKKKEELTYAIVGLILISEGFFLTIQILLAMSTEEGIRNWGFYLPTFFIGILSFYIGIKVLDKRKKFLFLALFYFILNIIISVLIFTYSYFLSLFIFVDILAVCISVPKLAFDDTEH
jgi:hypothetical protein